MDLLSCHGKTAITEEWYTHAQQVLLQWQHKLQDMHDIEHALQRCRKAIRAATLEKTRELRRLMLLYRELRRTLSYTTTTTANTMTNATDPYQSGTDYTTRAEHSSKDGRRQQHKQQKQSKQPRNEPLSIEELTEQCLPEMLDQWREAHESNSTAQLEMFLDQIEEKKQSLQAVQRLVVNKIVLFQSQGDAPPQHTGKTQ